MREVAEFFETRWKHFWRCWDHAQHHWLIAVPATLVLAYSIWTEYFAPFVDVPEIHITKLPLAWALVIFLAGLYFIVLEGSYRLLRHHSQVSDFDENDPKIVPECRWASVRFGEQIFQGRPITLVNRGGSDAKDIQVGTIVMPKGRAEFKPVGYLAKDKAENVLPDIEGVVVNGIKDIVDLLDKEWQFPMRADPIRQAFSIQYSASVGTGRFMTTGIIVRDPSAGTTEFHSLNFRKIPQAAS